MELRKYKLKDIAEIVNGATPSSSNADYYDGDVIWFTPKDLSDQKTKYIEKGERNLTLKGYESCSAKMLPAYSILMSSRAPIGLLSINVNPCCTNQGFKSLILNKEICDVDYLYYYLKYHMPEVESLGSGTTFKEVSKVALESLEVNLPSLQFQSKIAKILSLLDDKISLNREINRNLEALAKQLYDYWFVQFDFPNEEGKPYKSSGGKMVWNEKLKRDIPKGWENTTLGDFCEMYQPQTIGTNELVSNGLYRVYGANGIVGRYDKYNHEESEIAMACRGNSCGVLNRTMPYSWITGNAMVIRMRNNDCCNEFIKQALPYMNIAGAITGSGQPQLTRENLSAVSCIKPMKTILQAFSNKVTPIVSFQLQLTLENEELIKQRDELLPLLMNGQVSLNSDL
ncbi:restriction endonuclease subunit S [Pseudoprevotella muciniphila]|uniref:Restriction endonuclease subunit S n=2 Tax=Pseudoprevotella muciniphila TaxID=2133944 RepID=A0A5P8EA59_9BACT|nr:restriction endonuclease subunit S [Pseudoprevotella muciniphila]